MKVMLVYAMKQTRSLWIAAALLIGMFLLDTISVEPESIVGVHYLLIFLTPFILFCGLFYYHPKFYYDLTLPASKKNHLRRQNHCPDGSDGIFLPGVLFDALFIPG